MTDLRPSRRRRTRAARSRRRSLLIAGGCGLVIAGMLVLGATAQRGLPGRDHYELRADFREAANLGRYAEVRIAGRRVGQVTDVALEGEVARVRLQLDPTVRPLTERTTAHIRLKGLLGAKFVELRPAKGGPALPDGATIPATRTASTVELFDVFESLDEPRRKSLSAALDGLGAGFGGRGAELNAMLRTFPSALRDLTAAAREVNGRTGAAERLAPSLDAAAGAVDPVREDLARGWAPQGRALAPFVDRRSEVEDALEVAPGALRDLHTGLRATDPLVRQAARLARSTRALTRPAPAALRETTALLQESRPPLRTARALLDRTRDAVAPTLALTRRVDPLVAPIRDMLREPLPVLAEVDRRSCDLLGFARNWRSMLAYGVPGDHPIGPVTALRVTIVGSESTGPQLIADGPVLAERRRGYPEPCALGPVTPLQAGDGR